MLSVLDAAVERSPSEHGSPEGRHRPSRLRPARSTRRVQARVVRHVRSHDARFEEETVRYLYLMQILERPPSNESGSSTLGSGRWPHGPRVRWQLPWMTWKKISSARKSVSWNRRAWPVVVNSNQCSRSCVVRKSAAMIRAPADQAKNTKNATVRRRRTSAVTLLASFYRQTSETGPNQMLSLRACHRAREIRWYA